MEAAALSAAITATLKIVGNKLAPLVIKEYSSIVGVRKDLKELQDLAQEIICHLETAEDRDTGDAPWLKKLKEVSYDVDDVVDEFQLKAEKHRADGDGAFMSRYVHKKTESIIFQCKAARKIKKIKRRFAEIVKQRTDLTAIFGHRPVSHRNNTAVNTQTLPVGDEPVVLGRDQDMHKIISLLVETNDKHEIKIVSIVGLGGSGKTALAKLVFNDSTTIEKHFEVRLWVHVSQEFDLEKLIQKLFEAFADKDPGQHSLPYMSKRIREGLTQKKFLIVMDDVWTESQNQWGQIMGHLKTGAPGSRILLTTRSTKVAEAVQSTYQFCLPCLSPEDSWQLFQQSFRMPAKFLESNFIMVGKEIVETCCGLPLAIKVLAGSLGGKELIGEWQAMRNALLEVEGEESVSKCLKLSYFHLPSNLRRCFTMCSVFPKGHLIYKQQLIDQWIAHDMIILTRGADDLEHIGHIYFSSLVQVSFLEDVEETNGRVSCKMHDLVHDLARSILSEEISTSVPEDATRFTKGYRYLCLINIEQTRKTLPKKVFDNARAIYVYNSDAIISGKALKKAKHLRSVIADPTILTAILHVKNLKYLEMIYLDCEALPEAITDIWSLQAVHLTYSGLLELPKSIGKLQKLRTLNLSYSGKLKCLPDSIGDCNMLSSIDLFKCDQLTDLPNSIGRNKKLKVLRIGYTKIEKLPSSITMLKNLECLDLLYCRKLVELPEGIGNLEKLQVLILEDCYQLAGMPRGIGQLSQLQKLGLFVVGEGEKFAGISELANIGGNSEDLNIIGIERVMEPCDAQKACLKQKTILQRLNLEWNRHDDVGEANTKLQQSVLDGLEAPPGIKELEICGYSGRQYARWMQNEVGGRGPGIAHFSFLRVMNLFDLPNLKQLSGLVELPCLEVLVLENMPSLESISGGLFPSLVRLIMGHLPCLGDVWMVAGRTMSDGEEGGSCSNWTPHLGQEFRVGNCLSDLTITDCPKLKVKPYLPLSLQELHAYRVREQLLESPGRCEGYSPSFTFSHMKVLNLYQMVITEFESGLETESRWDFLQHMTALESLKIGYIGELTELPQSLGSLYSLQKLTIRSCDMSSLPQSIGHLTSLQSLDMSDCSAIHKLPECLGELCSLQQLNIKSCNSLSSLPQSMGHLTSLQKLLIEGCPALHRLPECLGELSSLQILYLGELPNIKCLPQSLHHLTSLQNLSIQQCNALHELPECLGDLRSLQKLVIDGLPRLACLPDSMCQLTSLKHLKIINCSGLTSLPQGMKSLASLEDLCISRCSGIKSLPEGIFGLTAMKRLAICGCSGVKSLPEGIEGLTSLQTLRILDCPGIKSLLKGIKGLTALKELVIKGCSDLARSCERGKGADWHLVSHIPHLWID